MQHTLLNLDARSTASASVKDAPDSSPSAFSRIMNVHSAPQRQKTEASKNARDKDALAYSTSASQLPQHVFADQQTHSWGPRATTFASRTLHPLTAARMPSFLPHCVKNPHASISIEIYTHDRTLEPRVGHPIVVLVHVLTLIRHQSHLPAGLASEIPRFQQQK